MMYNFVHYFVHEKNLDLMKSRWKSEEVEGGESLRESRLRRT